MTCKLCVIPETAPRHALVIGNKDYRVGQLTNPLNDARALSETLRNQLQFKVTLVENIARKGEMKDQILAAIKQVPKEGVFLFFYSGHGIELDSKNYLLPTGFELKSQNDLSDEALSLEWLLAEIHDARIRMNVMIILDACRDNPFPNLSRSSRKGLAGITGNPVGTLIFYAAAAGGTADDNPQGKNGLFTASLLQVMQTPGLKLEDVFKETGSLVFAQSGRKQMPTSYGSAYEDFYFLPPKLPVNPSQPIIAPVTPSPNDKRLSLALLPFQALSSDSRYAYLQEGLPNMLESRLNQIPQLDVTPLQASRSQLVALGQNANTLSGPATALRLGQLLAARYVLTGTYQSDRHSLQVNPVLLEIETGKTLYAETINTPLNKIHDLQGPILDRVFQALALKDSGPSPSNQASIHSEASLQAQVEGQQMLEQGQFRPAWQAFAKVVTHDPENIAGYQGLQSATEKLGNFNETHALFRKELSNPQHSPLIWNYQGNLFLLQKDWKQAEQAYHKVLAARPDFVPVYNNLGVHALLSKKDAKTAQSWFEKAIKLNPLDPWAHFNLGKMYYERKQYDPGQAAFMQALELSHGKLLQEIQQSLYGGSIKIYGRAKRLPGGEKIGEVVLEKDKKTPVVLFQIFDALGGFSPEERATIVAQRLKTMLFQLTPQAVRSGELNKEVVILADKQMIITVGARAAAREMLNKPALADKWSQRLLYHLAYEGSNYRTKSAAPEDSPEVQLLHEGDELYAHKRYQEALARYHEAVKLTWRFYPGHLARALIFEELGEYAEAEKNFEFVLDAAPNNLDALSGLANLYLKTAMYEEARKFAKQALAIEPGHSTAKAVLEKLAR